jgi:hypothetical protein
LASPRLQRHFASALCKSGEQTEKQPVAVQTRKEQIMKRIFNYLYTHQAVVLSVALALMVSSSFFVMIDAFNHVV